MFNECTSLEELDISGLSMGNKSTTYSDMLKDVPSDAVIYVDKTKFTLTESQCGWGGTFTNKSS